ncbi:MAG: MFS transporter [Pirellulales bacterium]
MLRRSTAELVREEVVSSPAAPPRDRGSYGWSFWLTFANNACLMIAASLFFRYSDFVKAVGGSELNLSWIVGVGMIGSIVMRLAQGVGIDRYGSRRIWVWSVGLFIVSCLAHLAIGRADTIAIYAVRILYAASLAGAFGASITFVSRTAPLARTAEFVGTLGSSGFIGMVVGSKLGDFLCSGATRAELDRLFLTAAGLGLAALLFAALATRYEVRPARRRRPHLLYLLKRYHGGMVMLVAVAMGVGIGLPTIWLRPFLATLGIDTIGWFFLVYAVTAFITRLSIRRMPEKIGIRPMIYIGLASMVGSMLAYLPVRTEWQAAVPAVLGGIAHAILFPAVVAGGSAVFPPRHRGVGTTLTLGAFDVGAVIGPPVAGGLLFLAKRSHLPAYPTMFLCMAGILTSVGVVYGFASRRKQPRA